MTDVCDGSFAGRAARFLKEFSEIGSARRQLRNRMAKSFRATDVDGAFRMEGVGWIEKFKLDEYALAWAGHQFAYSWIIPDNTEEQAVLYKIGQVYI